MPIRTDFGEKTTDEDLDLDGDYDHLIASLEKKPIQHDDGEDEEDD